MSVVDGVVVDLWNNVVDVVDAVVSTSCTRPSNETAVDAEELLGEMRSVIDLPTIIP